MAQGLLLASQFAAGGGFLVLAAGLLAVRFNSRVNRAFAVYLFLQGGAILVLAAARLRPGERLGTAFLDFLPHLVLPIPIVLLYFLVLYGAPRAGRAVRVAGIAAILSVVALNGAYLSDPCLLQCQGDGGTVAGPLLPVFHATPLALAVVACALARRSATENERASAMRVVANAMAMLALVEGSLIAAVFLTEGAAAWTEGFVANGWIVLQRLGSLVAFALSMAAFAILGRRGHWGRTLTIAALAFMTALMVNANGLRAEGGASPTSSQLMLGAWRLAAAVLVAYALVRHRFLALDETLSVAVRKGTVVTIMIATFLVVFQIVENVLDERLGWVFGGLATGLMLLAARPMERVGHRVAQAIVPRGGVTDAPDETRIALFREQAFMVWSDGVMGRKERLLLDNLRERLQIPLEVAAELESNAARHAPTVAKPALLSTA